MGAYISGILGGTAGKEAVSSFGEYKNSLRELKKSDFYIPWLIMNKNK
jgi:hypothetical protein